MTREQYDRWKDFAIRMAKTCFGRKRKQVLERTEQFFEWMESGCHAGDFADYLPAIEDWDSCGEWPAGSRWAQYGRPQPVCDFVSDMAEYWVPGYWGKIDRSDWERIEKAWCGGPSACIRAGLDVAVSPSAGVAGFTAGDIRRMYPDGVPVWVKAFVNACEPITVTGVVPGLGFTFEKTNETLPTFDEMNDDEPLWL